MSIISTALRAAGAAIKYAAKMVGRAAVGTVRSFGGAVKDMGRIGIGAARLAGRVVAATARVGYRGALVATGLAAHAANNIISMFGRGGGTELPEPTHQEVFSPTEEWVAEMETAHEAHELGEIESTFADNPDAEAYRYVVSDDKARRNMDLSAMSPDVRGWCHSLCESERLLVKRSGCEKMLRHLEGKKLITGVRKVKPRETILDFSQLRDNSFEMNEGGMLEPGTEIRMAV